MEYVIPEAMGVAKTLLGEIYALCKRTQEATEACARLHARLDEIGGALQKMDAAGRLAPSDALRTYLDLLTTYKAALTRYSERSLVGRLRKNSAFMEELRRLHEDVDALMRLFHFAQADAVMAWKEQWALDGERQLKMLERLTRNSALVMRELENRNAQVEALMVIVYEVTAAQKGIGNAPSPRVVQALKALQATIVRNSQAQVPSLPPWFLPEDDVEFEPTPFAQGSFGAVHQGTWGSGTKVVVKVLLVDVLRGSSSSVVERVRNEIEIWHQLHHPYVLKMYGACDTAKRPFIVSEDATNGNLADYLHAQRDGKKTAMWKLLYEAALGLEHLHKRRIVHCDLKLNNVLVGADGHARVADFGLSTVRTATATATPYTSSPRAGALRWRAPECLKRRPSFASDVYSLGMCIIEAATGEPPYAFADDATVFQLIRVGELPDPPAELSRDEWALVESMTRLKPEDRASLTTVISKLQEWAQQTGTSASASTWRPRRSKQKVPSSYTSHTSTTSTTSTTSSRNSNSHTLATAISKFGDRATVARECWACEFADAEACMACDSALPMVVVIELPAKEKLGVKLKPLKDVVIDHGLSIESIDNPLLEGKVDAGDLIVAIGGCDVDGMGFSSAIDLIRKLPRPLAIAFEIDMKRRAQVQAEKRRAQQSTEELDKELTTYAVVFDEGPMGLNLEDAERFGIDGAVVRALKGQAKTNGQISIGDIVFKVNDTDVLCMPYMKIMEVLWKTPSPKTLQFVPKDKLTDVQRRGDLPPARLDLEPRDDQKPTCAKRS